jgi:CDP-glucose 4,6-dehydratase
MTRLLTAYQGKRVIVTGDTGFKGSWLCMALRELGAEVVGYALPPRREDDHFNLLKLSSVMHHVDGDIRDESALRRVVDGFQPEFMFHLAAQALVRLSYEEPKRTFDTNVGGSVNVLEAARACRSLRALIFVTSDKCYRNHEWVWGYRENDELGGRDPYSASKAAAEMVFSAYSHSYFADRPGFGAASVRAGNVIGGGDWAVDRIVPDSIRWLHQGRPIILRSPGATRPWQHVLDPISGYLLLAARLAEAPKEFSGAWNFGPPSGHIRTVHDLAERLLACWGSGEIELDGDGQHPHEERLLHLNCDKAHRLLDWHARLNFEQAIAQTVAWYQDVLSGIPAMDVTRRQIQQFLGAGE